MTCWIIHWAFAEEQMEGQTHMQTCSLADFFTLVHSSIYLDTRVCIKIFLKTSTHTFSLHSAGVSLLLSLLLLTPRVLHVSATLASWYHRPVHSLSEQKKMTRYFYLPSSCLSILISFSSVTTSGFMQHVDLEWTFHLSSLPDTVIIIFSSKLLRFNSYSNF